MRKMEEDINTVLDEELNNCIQKLRDATFGYEVRTFITEYEELMLRKSSMITQKFVRDQVNIELGEHAYSRWLLTEMEEKCRNYQRTKC